MQKVPFIKKRQGYIQSWEDWKMRRVIDYATQNNKVFTDILMQTANHAVISKTGSMLSEFSTPTPAEIDKIPEIEDIFTEVFNKAVSSISRITPGWSNVAARLFYIKMKNAVESSLQQEDKRNYTPIKQVLLKGLEDDTYSKEIFDKYSDDDFHYFDANIKPARDFNFSYSALYNFNTKYCKKNSKGIPLELPQHTYLRVAMGLFYNKGSEFNKKLPWTRKELVIMLYDALSQAHFTLSSPIMNNAFTPLNQMSSCILNTIGNSTYDLMNKLTTAGLYTKGEAGLGFDISQVQAIGSRTRRGVISGGIVPHIQNIQSVIRSLMQSNSRRGAAAITCAWWHYEIQTFLELKDATSGTPENRALHLKYTLATNEYLYDAVKENREITLFDPLDTPLLNKLHGKEWVEAYESYKEDRHIRRIEVKAKDVFGKFLRMSFQVGNIYEIMLDEVNRRTMTNRHIGSSNLCVSGNTTILTQDKGNVPISSLVGKTVKAWNGEEWSDTYFDKTSDGQEVMEVHFNSSETIKATPYHRWSVVKQDEDGRHIGTEIKRTSELKKGDKLEKFSLEPITHGTKPIGLNGEFHPSFFVPNGEYLAKDRFEWLSEYLGREGTLTTDDNGIQSIQTLSSCNKFLFEIRLLLQEFGIHSKVTEDNDTVSRLTVEGSELSKLVGLGCVGHVVERKGLHGKEESLFIEIKDVVSKGEIIPTYCGKEPLRERLVMNGVLSMNCVEILEPSRPSELIDEVASEDGIITTRTKGEEIAQCNLASINAMMISDMKDEEFKTLAFLVMLTLDTTIDIGTYQRAAGKFTNDKYRYTAVGISNYARFLAEKGVHMNDEGSKIETFKLMDKFSHYIILASTELARVFGKADGYAGTKWEQGLLPYDTANELLKANYGYLRDNDRAKALKANIAKYGVRNILMMGIAPTASSATSAPGLDGGLTEGIDPLLKAEYTLEGAVKAITLAPALNKLGSKYSFAYETNQEDLIINAAIRQMFIDQSQSTSVFIKEDNWDYQYLAGLHYLAQKLGMTTLYYTNTPKRDIEDCLGCSA